MKVRISVLIALAACSHLPSPASPRLTDGLTPRADYHTHLRSPDDSAYIGDGSRVRPARELIAVLDAGGVRKALVASTAYFFGAPDAVPDATRDEYTRVRDDNDWLATQIAQYPSRLVGFCAVNPLRAYALREIARCNGIGLHGLKLHFANARVDLDDSANVEKVRAVFAAANAQRLPLLVHLRSRSAPFGAREARIFIEKILPAAPDVPVQLAHLAGWGSYDQGNDAALGAFLDAMKSGEIDRARLYFDLAAVYIDVWHGIKLEPVASSWTPVIARRLREIGLDHVLFGTDWPGSGCCQSESAITAFLSNESGLTREEVRQVFANVAPYMR